MHEAAFDRLLPIIEQLESVLDYLPYPHESSIGLKLAYLLSHETKAPMFVLQGPGCTTKGLKQCGFHNLFHKPTFAPTNNSAWFNECITTSNQFRLHNEHRLLSQKELADKAFSKESDDAIWLSMAQRVLFSEATLLSSIQLDNISGILKHVYWSEDTLGGIDVIFLSDPYQYQPIVSKEDRLKILKTYPSLRIFDSKAYNELDPICIEVNENHAGMAQDYLDSMILLKTGKASKRILDQFKKQIRNGQGKMREFEIEIVFQNDEMEAVNNFHYERMQGYDLAPVAKIIGEFKTNNNYPPNILKLKEGVQIMFTDSDPGGLYNYGELGIVVDLQEEEIEVRKISGKAIKVRRQTWHQRGWMERGHKWVYDIVASMEQFPLRIAKAVTIHRSIGLCFDQVYINNHFKRYHEGQIYAALTRCRSFDGLVLGKPLTANQIKVDPRYHDLYKNHRNIERIEQNLTVVLDAYQRAKN